MSTSLAEQLKRLAVPQTSVLKRDKKRASLLFDPKEAAGIKRETIYQIGVEGLEELILKNDVFNQFKDTLFHITSKDFERAVHDSETNNKLNKSIKKFLLLLSPYFLLNCSHKVLEWLINRYMINEYNRDDLLMLILPYHESNIFVRVVQLLQFKDESDTWYFLKALQKPGVHLPKQALLNHAAGNAYFLKFVTKFILQLIKTHEKPSVLTVPFNFYCTVFTGVIEYSEEVKEDQISQMLVLILKGLSSLIPDFCAASYVITARLVAKTTLSDKLLDKLVEKISQVNVDSLKTEACLVLLVLYQSQKQYKKISAVAVGNLSGKDWLPKVLQDLNATGSFIYLFLEQLVKGCVIQGTIENLEKSRNFITNLINQVKLDDEYVANILHSILDAVSFKLKYSEEAKNWLSEIIQTLERQYPNAFDKEVYNILTRPDEELIKRKKCLQKILKKTMIYEGKFDMFEKLYHPNPEFRSEAVKFLKHNYKNLRETDKDIIKNLFVDRLNDDNVQVVKETLKVISKSLILDNATLKNILISLARKCQFNKTGFREISFQVLKLLSLKSQPSDWGTFLAIFPFILPSSSDDLTQSKRLVNCNFAAENCVLKPIKADLIAANSSETFTNLILESLKKVNDLNTVTDFIKVLKEIPLENRDCLHKYLSSVILSALLPDNSSLEMGSMVLEILVSNYQGCTETTEKEKSLITSYIGTAIKNKFPVAGFLKCMENVTEKTVKSDVNLELVDFSQSNETVVFFILLTSTLCKPSPVYRRTFTKFLDNYCQTLERKLGFLLNLSASGNANLGDQKEITTFLSKILEDYSEDTSSLISFDSILTAQLLIALHNESSEIRTMWLESIKILVKSASKKSGNYFALLEGIVKHWEEIVLDHEQLPLAIYNLLAPENTKGKKLVRDLNSARNNLVKLVCNDKYSTYFQAGVLKLISRINAADIFEETAKIALKILQKNPEQITGFESIIVIINVKWVEAEVLKKLNFQSNAWKFLEAAFKNDKTTIFVDEKSKITPAVLVLGQLNNELFSALSDEVVEVLLQIIVETSTLATNLEVLPAVSRVFKHIDLDCKLILSQLRKMRDVQSPKQNLTRKRRVSVVPTVDILDTLDWKRGVSILEFIQDKKKIRNINSLIPILFELLKKCLNFDEQAAVEYPKQLILSLILHCCKKRDEDDEKLPDNVFEMPLIVQCIRASQNPQTHHHALLVLAHVAVLIPTQVVQHMIPIFTFVGSSFLRHDDAYSFQIMTKIIDTVIPILVSENRIQNIAKVLRDFVDAVLDVPEHKRMPLYKQLLNKIDVKEYLYLFLLLIFESQVVHHSHEQKQSVDKKITDPKRLEIAANLCREFSPDVVIHTCIKLIKYLKDLPDEKVENMEIDEESPTFNIANYTAKQFRHYKFTLVTFTSNFLASAQFVNQVAALSDEELLNLEELYKEMVINILTYIQRISKVAEKNSNTLQAHYWKSLLHHSYDMLDSINALLTPQMFLLVTRGLMVHNLAMVRRRSLELLNSKLQYESSFFNDCDKSEIYAIIPPITTIIQTVNNNQLENDQEQIIQIALLSLKLLVKFLASQDPEKFVQILDFITTLIRSGKAQNNVLASAVLCLAELCANLRAHAISSLPSFMPVIIKVLKQQKNQESSSVLLLSVLTALQKIFDSLPLFLSPYLEKLLVELTLLMSKLGDGQDDQKLQPFVNKLTLIRQKIGSIIPSRVLIPAVEQCYTQLIEKKHFNAISSLMDILGENLASLKGNEVASNLPELTTFFLNALQFRADGKSLLDEANVVEGHIIKALTVLILKLSESTFRPLYYKLFDWAVRNEAKSERLITFYSLSKGIAQSLKGLFVLFAGHFLNNAAQILDSCNRVKSETLYFNEESKDILLLENVLGTLSAVFMYDNQKFVNKDRFEVLMQPLVDQLENTLGGVDGLVKRSKILTPCLVQFAVATADDALWKQMNYQILLKMRHDSPGIRLNALQCLTEIVKKVGEDFLPLLPETIPFLAELLEDEEETVEKACQKAVQEMEKVLGEPLQKYF